MQEQGFKLMCKSIIHFMLYYHCLWTKGLCNKALAFCLARNSFTTKYPWLVVAESVYNRVASRSIGKKNLKYLKKILKNFLMARQCMREDLRSSRWNPCLHLWIYLLKLLEQLIYTRFKIVIISITTFVWNKSTIQMHLLIQLSFKLPCLVGYVKPA